jgi:catechol 2,3-dioxygenase-like lactoylglutathione lyase family enzyme
MSITAVPDHVAVAVRDMDAAAKRWRDELGGGWATPRLDQEEAPFATRQLRYPGGAKLELLEPIGTGFAHRFLERYGPRIHHVTLKVDDLLAAVDELRDADFDVVDVFAEGDVWHEAFLRPSQVGGMIVQVAWAGQTDAEWAEMLGTEPEVPSPDAAQLLGPTLTHPDLAQAGDVWATLGGNVAHTGDELMVSWDGGHLDVRIEAGPTAGPVGLRFLGAPDLAADEVAGPGTLAG